jgi:photosystem II stability/assembly factor-like uncharacterized protein
VDVQTVWQCGLNDTQVSMDSGQTWEGTGTAGGNNCMVSFADAKTGWLFGARKLKATKDGGGTWEEVSLPEGARVAKIAAISLRAAGEGYIVTSDAVLHVTQDGGKSWSSLPFDLEEYEGMMLLSIDRPSAAIRFFDADNGLVVLSLVGGGKSIVAALRTTDGGETWTDEVVLSGDAGIPYLTRDGKFLTLTSLLEDNQITVLEYKGD